MPYVEVWIDPADADLDVFSDDELREELNARARRKNSNPSLNEAIVKYRGKFAWVNPVPENVESLNINGLQDYPARDR